MTVSGLAGRQALAAFGRNDIRGTYRDPLLVMIVAAPIIWTLGVVVLTPLFTEMLAERYESDLVPYYPLVLTAFLLLTSIVIAGGLGAFLVLDEVDAGTLTALRVTPVPLSTFFAYRAGTVMAVTTVYVVATMSFSGILAPALIPALIPIGLLAGLSAVVTLLLIVAVASNKIQGIAMVRALGMLIAGAACLPWFIDSGMEFGLRGAAAVLGGQVVLGGQRPRHLVALPRRRRRLQRRRHLAAVPALPRQEHLNIPAHRCSVGRRCAGKPGRQFIPATQEHTMNNAAAPTGSPR